MYHILSKSIKTTAINENISHVPQENVLTTVVFIGTAGQRLLSVFTEEMAENVNRGKMQDTQWHMSDGWD